MRSRRIFGRSVALVSTAAIAASLALSRSSQLVVVAIVAVVLLWGALPQAIDAFLGEDEPEAVPSSTRGTFTVVLHVGGQSDEVSRVSVLAATTAAPTIVVTVDAQLAERIGPVPCPVVVRPTVEEAINAAVELIATDAVLVISAGSFVSVEGAAEAAGLIRDGAGWTIGLSRTFNRDGFSPLVRGRLSRRLRASARAAGLQLWEPNATSVGTDLFRFHPLEPGRPWGAALRAMHTSGHRGCHRGITLSLTAEPVDARSYWPASVWRRRRAVADLADAILTTQGRARWLATGLLLRELDGVVLAVWLLSPWLLTVDRTFAFRCPLWSFALLVAVPAVLRWIAQRLLHRLRPHPMEDMLSMAFEAPGSVLSLQTLFSRRVRPTRVALSGQPLVVALVMFAAITMVPLLAGGTTARRSGAVGSALAELGLLWLMGMRVVFQRNWMRTTYRIRSALPVSVGKQTLQTIDVSPAGLSIAGRLDARPGSRLDVVVWLSDGSQLSVSGTVEGWRSHHGIQVTGLSVELEPTDRARWIAQLSRSAAEPAQHTRTVVPVRSVVRQPALPRRWLRRGIVATIALISLAAASTLTLALLGYRPLIVRSGSMEPALHVGDVVLVEDVEVRQLAVGEISTLADPAEVSDSLTHRVTAIDAAGDAVAVTTRGDANTTSETFRLPPTAIVGRVVVRVPAVGTVVAWAGSRWVRIGAAAIGVMTMVGVVAWGRRSRNRPYPAGDDGLADAGVGVDAHRAVRV